MLSESEIRELLRDEHTYNFRHILEQACNEAAHFSAGTEKLINTLELFSYGTISMYKANAQAFLVLDPQEQRKLTELTILKVLNQNVGNEVSLQHLLSKVEPEINNYDDLETLLINMIEYGVISVKIDEIKQVVLVKDTPKLRDAYNEDKYTLRVLSREDVEDVLLQQAKIHLRRWLDEKVIPNSQSGQLTN